MEQRPWQILALFSFLPLLLLPASPSTPEDGADHAAPIDHPSQASPDLHSLSAEPTSPGPTTTGPGSTSPAATRRSTEQELPEVTPGLHPWPEPMMDGESCPSNWGEEPPCTGAVYP